MFDRNIKLSDGQYIPREAPVSITTISLVSLISTVDWVAEMMIWDGKSYDRVGGAYVILVSFLLRYRFRQRRRQLGKRQLVW